MHIEQTARNANDFEFKVKRNAKTTRYTVKNLPDWITQTTSEDLIDTYKIKANTTLTNRSATLHFDVTDGERKSFSVRQEAYIPRLDKTLEPV